MTLKICPSSDLGHAYSFKDRDGFNFEWNNKSFQVVEKCSECGYERLATYEFSKEEEVKNWSHILTSAQSWMITHSMKFVSVKTVHVIYACGIK